jgi:hypothetical protein
MEGDIKEVVDKLGEKLKKVSTPVWCIYSRGQVECFVFRSCLTQLDIELPIRIAACHD